MKERENNVEFNCYYGAADVMKTWSSDEIDILKENYNKVSNKELQKMIPTKTETAIYKKAYKMGFRKTKEIAFVNRSLAKKGAKSNFWNGGKATTTKGYRRIKMPGHHRADSKGYVLEHILVYEKETGIQIPENCCVHHLNGKKNDNRIENLCMMTHSAHTAFHNLETTKTKKEGK